MLTDSLLGAEQAGPSGSNLAPTGEFHAAATPVTSADRFREAARAIADIRRGAAVVMIGVETPIAVAVAETLDASGLAMLSDVSMGPLFLVRPAGLGNGRGDPTFVARAMPRDMPFSAWRRLADPLEFGTPDSVTSALPDGCAEAIVLVKLAGLLPSLAVARIGPDGVARARGAGAIVVQAADVVALRTVGARLERVGEAPMPLEGAPEGRVVAFRSPETGAQQLAVVIGHPERSAGTGPAPLVRLHSECFTGDVLGSLRCDCGPQLRDATRRMTTEGAGVVLYLAQEGRGIGLLNKLRSYALQDRGLDTLDANTALGFAADERDFTVAAAMLRALGVTRIRLLTNNPAKLAALAANGIEVERASLLIATNGVNDGYMATKAARFGHLSA